MRKQDAVPMLRELVNLGREVKIGQRVLGTVTTITKENLEKGIEILKQHNDIEWSKNECKFYCYDKPQEL